jgi:aspartyl-tRNA(Asn)/glutamyl-tRNA(Gln) amidotransferase subunit A
MEQNELQRLTALQLGRAIQVGEVSPLEATQCALAAIHGGQERYNAYVTVTEQQALSRAEALGKARPTGALAGVPAAVKDNICTLGVTTTCASKILGDFKPPYNATVMERFDAAGGVLLGKLNMDEFAMGSTSETGFYGSVKNPWDITRVAGGSSGGAAAAVAAGECWYALGSDTGGSIRQPAAYCGVTGMKPTYGTVSRYGLVAYASSLDQIGPLARTAEDCAAVLDMIQGRDARDATSLDVTCGHLLEGLSSDLTGMKIGIPEDCFGDGLDDTVRTKVLAVAEVLRARGAQVEQCRLPVMDYVIPTYYILASAEASSNLSRFDGVKYGWRAEEYEDLTDLYCKTRTEGFGREVRRRILLGTFVLSTGYYDAYYQKALQSKAIIKKAFDDLMARYDLLLTPVTPTTAPRLGQSLDDPLQMYLSDLYTVSVNLAGLPALSMPCGFDAQGLPIGAQLIGAPLGEQKVLNAAYAYQQDTDHHLRRPGKEGA